MLAQKQNLSVTDFVSEMVSKLSGIQLGERQQSMVQSRFSKHLSELGLREDEYLDYFHVNESSETQALISLLTTHHTYFFREYSHFEYLESTAFPELIKNIRKREDKTLRIWSAACSRGQEVYSLAMCAHLYLSKNAPDIKFEILGSDIDEKSVQIAKNGVYLHDEIKEVPLPYIANHWARGTGEISAYAKVKKELKNCCTFQQENLFQISEGLKNKKFDIIFCRNVFIYFDQNQIQKLAKMLLGSLTTGGHLFVGISETLRGLRLPVVSPGPSIYLNQADQIEKTQTKLANAPSTTPQQPAIIRVLCVDDSPSILALLKKGLTKEYGFEVVGVAINGIDAKEKIRVLKPDVITMDIHMPEQGGLEYLEENFGPGHPPVMMVSSVSRENADLAMKAMRLGAVDYVEKPSLPNMAERSEEIRTKLKIAYKNKTNTNTKPEVAVVDREFESKTKTQMQNTEQKIRMIFAQKEDLEKLRYFLKNQIGIQPPTVILLENDYTFPEKFMQEYRLAQLKSGGEALTKNQVYVGNLAQCSAQIVSKHVNKQASVVLFGANSTATARVALSWHKRQLLVEDLSKDPIKKHLSVITRVASDVVPYTSFPYMSNEYLNSEDKSGSKT